jgi:hypothetical protein
MRECRGDTARVINQDRLRCAKDTGLGRLLSRQFAINAAWFAAAWFAAAAIAVDFIRWRQVLGLRGDLALAGPKRLRYRLLHTAARLTRWQRRRRLRVPVTWPWATRSPPRSPKSRPSPPPADPSSPGPDEPEDRGAPRRTPRG